jgi:hypothetical protein
VRAHWYLVSRVEPQVAADDVGAPRPQVVTGSTDGKGRRLEPTWRQ